MIGKVVLGILVNLWPQTPAVAAELRVQVEIFDWNSREPAPKGAFGLPKIPENAKPAVSFGVKVIPGTPFAADVIVASRKFELSGTVKRAVEKAHMASVRFLSENSRGEERREITTDIKLSPNVPIIIGGSTSTSTHRGADFYSHWVMRVKIVKEDLVK